MRPGAGTPITNIALVATFPVGMAIAAETPSGLWVAVEEGIAGIASAKVGDDVRAAIDGIANRTVPIAQ